MPNHTAYTDEIAEAILEGIADGIDLEQVCRDLRERFGEKAPRPRTVRDWTAQKAEFGKLYQQARDDGEFAIAAKMRATTRGRGPDAGGESSGDVQRDKLIVETDLKLLAKFNPKRWGDRHVLAGDPEAPLHGMSDADLDRAIAEKLSALQGGG